MAVSERELIDKAVQERKGKLKPIENINSLEDIFICERFQCEITAKQCIGRQTYKASSWVSKETNSKKYMECKHCEQGRKIMERIENGDDSDGLEKICTKCGNPAKKIAKGLCPKCYSKQYQQNIKKKYQENLREKELKKGKDIAKKENKTDGPKINRITICFQNGNEFLFERLQQISKEEFRTIQEQILYYINRCIRKVV